METTVTGSGDVPSLFPCLFHCAGEVESTAEHSDWTPSRPKKVTNVDVA